MILYFAGSESGAFRSILKQAGVKNILNSYHPLSKMKTMANVATEFPNLLLDSGGFSARVSGKVIDVRKYARFINDHGVKLAINLDTNDLDESLRNANYLRHECTHCTILDVYHVEEFFQPKNRDLIKRYADRNPYVCYGGIATRNMPAKYKVQCADYIFSMTKNETRVHGLAVTSMKMIRQYPWYSVDSTTWLSGAKYGITQQFNHMSGIINAVHSSDLHKTAGRNGRGRGRQDIIPALGSYQDRLKQSVLTYLDLEDFITNYWKARGITWTPMPLLP
jgi:hypothetical protein